MEVNTKDPNASTKKLELYCFATKWDDPHQNILDPNPERQKTKDLADSIRYLWSNPGSCICDDEK